MMVKVQYIILKNKTKQVLHVETSEITNHELSYLEYQEMVKKTSQMAKKYSNARWKIEISVV